MPSRRYEAPFVLVVDVGSSSVRAALFDARARPIEGTISRAPLQLRIARRHHRFYDILAGPEASVGTQLSRADPGQTAS